MSVATGAPETSKHSPVILDLGKHKKGDIKKLCAGEGPLLDEVNSCIEELKISGAITAHAQPVVIVVRQKAPRNAMLWPIK